MWIKYCSILFFLRRVQTLFYSLYFNFRILPFKQAVKIPFYVYVWPTIISNKGNVVFETAFPIKKGMIKIGRQGTPIYRKEVFMWHNDGTIVFKGCVSMRHHTMIMVIPGAYLEIGDQTMFNAGCRIGVYKKVVFGYKSRISWDCQFYDTDFHPIIDLVRNRPLKMTVPILIGDNTWIGHNVIISKGVKLAEGVIVSSGSVVKKSISIPHCIVAGNPAEIIDEGYKPVFKDLNY